MILFLGSKFSECKFLMSFRAGINFFIARRESGVKKVTLIQLLHHTLQADWVNDAWRKDENWESFVKFNVEKEKVSSNSRGKTFFIHWKTPKKFSRCASSSKFLLSSSPLEFH